MPRDVPAIAHPATNRQVILNARPKGVPGPEHFSLRTAQVPRPGPGEMLLRNVYLSVDPAQRGWAGDVANYAAPVELGSVMRALAVAQVVESRAEGFAPGDFVYGLFGWQDYAAVRPGAVHHRCTQDLPLDAFASLCGINGVTAWIGLTELGRPRPGEVLVVSTAAGSVGSIVGQIGKTMGCRTIGITGSQTKVARCREVFGFDVALNYRREGLEAALAEAAPDGVNVYFDNTGGSILDTVLRRMAVRGRIVACGTAAHAVWNPPPTGPRVEREIMTRRLIWSGLVVLDHLDRYHEACEALASLHARGALHYRTDLRRGIEAAPGALAALYAGANDGKLLIDISAGAAT